MNELTIVDTTLREGEQAAGGGFSLDDRLAVATALARAGMHQIQAGYPGVSDADRKLVRALVDADLDLSIEAIAMVHVDDWRAHIEATLACEPDIVSMQFGISPVRLERVLRMTPTAVLARIAEAIEYAKSHGAVVSFTPTDTTRADPDFVAETYRVIEQAGADRVRLADSIGVASPQALRPLIDRVQDATSLPLAVHFHNDYGLALANMCAAVEAGVRIVDASVLGLGERCGNVCLEEAVLVVEDHYGLDSGVDRGALMELSTVVAERARYSIPPMKPVVGRNAFAHQLDNHVRGVLLDPSVYEPYDPASVGNSRQFPIGRLSGPHALRQRCRELGIDLGDVALETFVARVRKFAESERREIADDELIDLARPLERAPAEREVA